MFRTLVLLALFAAPVRADDKPKPNALTAKEIADGWVLLFDGETTFGWTAEAPKGGNAPEARVKDGVLTISGKGGSVRPKAAFEHFELRGEYRTSEKGARLSVGLSQAGTVGITMSDEFALGKEGEWRPFVTKLTKDETEINAGEKGTTGLSGASLGIAALGQVSVELPAAGAALELRNIKLCPLGSKPLFNGKDLTGWKVNGADPKRVASKWSVTKEGELAVKDGPGDLVCEKEFANFVLQFECKTNGKALNSGIFFRCIPGQYQNGYEAQIQNAYKDDDRTKPADFGTGAIYRRIAARKVVSNDNEWFTMTVAANGKHISTWVNGYQTVDWTDDRKENDNPRQGYRAAKGPLSIQGHDPTTDILFRNIRVGEFPAK